MNKTSVTLRDGSGYAGYLETFHMLHCVVGDPHNRSQLGEPRTICSYIMTLQKRFYQLRNKEHYTDVQETGGLNPAHLGKISNNKKGILFFRNIMF